MLAMAAIGLAGCGSAPVGGGSTATGGGSGDAGVSSFKVALLTSGDINDQGWNQLGYEGLQAVKQELGADISNQVTKQEADQQPALHDYADQGYNLVICNGFEFGERVKAIAPKYPKTMFLVNAGSVKQAPNVATLVPKLEESTYLLGMIAGGMTKSNVIGAVGGEQAPEIKSTFDAFTEGAKAVNPNIKVLTAYVGNWDDSNKGKICAQQIIAQRADFIFQNADQAGKGVFAAAQDAKNVYVIGSNRDQTAVAPDICLASAVINMPKAFVDAAKSAKDGKFKPDFIEQNMPNGDITIAWNPALKSKIPAALLAKEQAAEAQIVSGKLKIARHV